MSYVISFTAVLVGTAEEFDAAAYRQRLAEAVMLPEEKVLVQDPRPMANNWLHVTATMDLGSAAVADETLVLLTKRSRQANPTLSARLGVAIVRVERLAMDSIVRTAPSPPPPISPSPPPAPPALPSPAAPPPPRSVEVSFLAPRAVGENTLATVRMLDAVFAQALGVPSSWLEIGLAESDSDDIKVDVSQILFVLSIELKAEHYTLELVARIRSILGDEERLKAILLDAVPGATLVASSIASPAPPPPPLPPLLPVVASPPPPPASTPAAVCKRCPAGFMCPEGSVQPVPCAEGTEQPREGEAECVVVSSTAADAVSNSSAAGNAEMGGLDSASEVNVGGTSLLFANWVPIVSVSAVAVCFCFVFIAMCIWRHRRLKLKDEAKARLVAQAQLVSEPIVLADNLREEASNVLRLAANGESPSPERPRVSVLVQKEGEPFRPHAPRKSRWELRKAESVVSKIKTESVTSGQDSRGSSPINSSPDLMRIGSIKRASEMLDGEWSGSASRDMSPWSVPGSSPYGRRYLSPDRSPELGHRYVSPDRSPSPTSSGPLARRGPSGLPAESAPPLLSSRALEKPQPRRKNDSSSPKEEGQMSDDDLDSYASTSNTVSPWGRRGMARITPRGDNSRDRSPAAGSASPTPSRGESPVLRRPSAAVATSAVTLSPAPMRREDSCSFGGRLKRGDGFGRADHTADEANLKAMDAAFKLGTAGSLSPSELRKQLTGLSGRVSPAGLVKQEAPADRSVQEDLAESEHSESSDGSDTGDEDSSDERVSFNSADGEPIAPALPTIADVQRASAVLQRSGSPSPGPGGSRSDSTVRPRVTASSPGARSRAPPPAGSSL